MTIKYDAILGMFREEDTGGGTPLIDPLIYKGVIACVGNPNYPAGDAGHVYVVSSAGKIGGASGINVEVGDLILCNTDGTTAGDQAAKGAYWDIIQKNIEPNTFALIGQTMYIGTTAVAINRATAPLSLTGISIDGNAATVTNATFTTALTVNTGTLTLTANAANTSVLTIGAGAVSVSGANTGDNATNSQYSGLAASKADVGQTFYIGTTQVAINRTSAALTLSGITLDTPAVTTSISTPSIVTASGALGVTPAAGSNLNISLSTTGDFTVNTTQLYIDTSTARVGIGTATPSCELHVVGSIRNEGQFLGTNGSVTSPVLVSIDDLNTGIYFPAADTIGFSAGGVLKGTFSAAGFNLGTSTATTGAIVFYNATNSNTLTIQSGVTGASITHTLPIVAPTDGQVLSSTAAGVMSWATVSGGSTLYSLISDNLSTSPSILSVTQDSTLAITSFQDNKLRGLYGCQLKDGRIGLTVLSGANPWKWQFAVYDPYASSATAKFIVTLNANTGYAETSLKTAQFLNTTKVLSVEQGRFAIIDVATESVTTASTTYFTQVANGRTSVGAGSLADGNIAVAYADNTNVDPYMNDIGLCIIKPDGTYALSPGVIIAAGSYSCRDGLAYSNNNLEVLGFPDGTFGVIYGSAIGNISMKTYTAAGVYIATVALITGSNYAGNLTHPVVLCNDGNSFFMDYQSAWATGRKISKFTLGGTLIKSSVEVSSSYDKQQGLIAYGKSGVISSNLGVVNVFNGDMVLVSTGGDGKYSRMEHSSIFDLHNGQLARFHPIDWTNYTAYLTKLNMNPQLIFSSTALAGTMMTYDLGTAAVAHVGLNIKAYGASASQRGIKIDLSSGTGYGLEITGAGTGNILLNGDIKFASSKGINYLGSTNSVTLNNFTGTSESGISGFFPQNNGGGVSGTVFYMGGDFCAAGNIRSSTGNFFYFGGYLASNNYGINVQGTFAYFAGLRWDNGADGAGVFGRVISVAKMVHTNNAGSLNASVNYVNEFNGGYLGQIVTHTAGIVLYTATQSGGTFLKVNATTGTSAKYISFNSAESSATLGNRTTDTQETLFSRTSTRTTGTTADNFNLQYLKRTSIQNGAGGTYTSAGSVLKLENVATQTAGTLTDTTDVLHLLQGVDTTGNLIRAQTNAVDKFIVTKDGAVTNVGGLVVNAQTGTTYDIVLADAGKLITLNNGSAITVTIPANGTIAMPVGTIINLEQLGAGQVTVAITTDTLVSYGSVFKLAGQNAGAYIRKIASTTWILIGNISA